MQCLKVATSGIQKGIFHQKGAPAMYDLKLRIKVGSTLRPEEFPTRDFIEAKVEEVVSLSLQTIFDFAETEITGIDDMGHDNFEEPPMRDDHSRGELSLPDDLL